MVNMEKMTETITDIFMRVEEHDRSEVRKASGRVFEEFLKQEGIVAGDERIPMLKAVWNVAIEVAGCYVDLREETDYRLPEACSLG